MKIHNQRDFASGLLFLLIGGGFALGASNYRLGSAVSMGPGYFPFGVGLVLAVIGLGVLLGAVRSTSAGQGSSLGSWDLRGLFIILISVALFGLLVERAGLVIAVAVATVVSCLAEPTATWRAVLVNAVSTLTISIVIFVFMLGLQIPVLPRFAGG